MRALFATIADRYDFITVALSYGQDRRWKRRLVDLAAPRPGARALDLATGTGDIAFALAARGARVVGLDITQRMIELAHAKTPARTTLARRVPRRRHAGAAVSAALVRPRDDRLRAAERAGSARRRSTRSAACSTPGGQLLSLDFNRPANALVRAVYLAYLTVVGGALGWVLHRDPDTYRYIPGVDSAVSWRRGVARMFEARGFHRVRYYPVLGGLMAIHHAVTKLMSRHVEVVGRGRRSRSC